MSDNLHTGNGQTPPPGLVPDRGMLMQFVKTMFRNANEDGFVSFRIFRDNGKSEQPVLISAVRLNDHEFMELMLISAEQAATWFEPAVFAPPVCSFKNHLNAKTDNIHEGPVLSVECDSAPAAARVTLEALLGAATVISESGGEWVNDETGEVENKVHLHWRLKKPAATLEELALLYEARSLATRLVGADPTAKSIVHPLRWPGSWHRKKTPKLARIAALSEDAEIELGEAVARLREATGITELVTPDRISGDRREASDQSMVASTLAAIPNDSTLKDEKGRFVHDWDYWNTVGMTIWASTGGSEEGRLEFHKWSAKARKYNKAETEKRWQHYFRSPPTKLGFGSLVWRARQADPDWRYQNTLDAVTEAAVGGFIAQLLREADYAGSAGTGGSAGHTAGGGTPGGAAGVGASGSAGIEPVDLWAKFDPPPLPPALLPQVIENFATDRAATLGADVAGFAVTALSVCAGAISDEIKLEPKRNDTEWREAARLWTLLIGDPSTMKSPVVAAVTKSLRRIDHQLAHDYQVAMARWLEQPKDGRGPPPPKLRAMIFDTTIEATQEILRDSPAGVLLEDDELSGWFDAMYKYSGARGAQKDRSFWLKAYDGGAKTVDRIGRGTVHIRNLSISIAGASQPGPIRKLANAGEDDGLLQRFNPLMLRPATGGRDEPAGPAVADFDTLVGKLRGLRSQAVLKFDDGALKIREELERKHLDLMQTEWLNRRLTSHFGKYNGMFARLCLVWHCVEHASSSVLMGPPLPVVVTESIARRVADFLHGFLAKHAFAFYASVLGLSNDHERLTNLADYILAHGLTRVTNRDVQRGDRSMRGLERHETTAIFEQLEALGWVDIVPSPKAGYPPHWVVNPLVHQRFAERAKASKERREKGHEMAKEISASIKSKATK